MHWMQQRQQDNNFIYAAAPQELSIARWNFKENNFEILRSIKLTSREFIASP